MHTPATRQACEARAGCGVATATATATAELSGAVRASMFESRLRARKAEALAVGALVSLLSLLRNEQSVVQEMALCVLADCVAGDPQSTEMLLVGVWVWVSGCVGVGGCMGVWVCGCGGVWVWVGVWVCLCGGGVWLGVWV